MRAKLALIIVLNCTFQALLALDLDQNHVEHLNFKNASNVELHDDDEEGKSTSSEVVGDWSGRWRPIIRPPIVIPPSRPCTCPPDDVDCCRTNRTTVAIVAGILVVIILILVGYLWKKRCGGRCCCTFGRNKLPAPETSTGHSAVAGGIPVSQGCVNSNGEILRGQHQIAHLSNLNGLPNQPLGVPWTTTSTSNEARYYMPMPPNYLNPPPSYESVGRNMATAPAAEPVPAKY